MSDAAFTGSSNSAAATGKGQSNIRQSMAPSRLLLHTLSVVTEFLYFAEGRLGFDGSSSTMVINVGKESVAPLRMMGRKLLLPSEITTTPLRVTNNLIRVITNPSLALSVKAADAHDTATGSDAHSASKEVTLLKPALLDGGFHR